jgi:hypothetical protein
MSRGKVALDFWREYEKTAPEEMTNGALIFTAPPELPVPDILRQKPIVGIGGVYTGPLDVGEKLLRPLRQFGPPLADIYQVMPYNAAQTMADWLWPKGNYNHWKSSFLRSLSRRSIRHHASVLCDRSLTPNCDSTGAQWQRSV